jgi:hypothetical protein
MFWYTFSTPADAVAVKMYFHSHMEQIRRILCFQAKPQQVGLDVGELRFKPPNALNFKDADWNSAETAEAYLMKNYLTSALSDPDVKLLCRLANGMYEYVLFEGTIHPFARQATNLLCEDQTILTKGKPLTVIAFYDTRATPGDLILPGHLHFWPIMHEFENPYESRYLNGGPELSELSYSCYGCLGNETVESEVLESDVVTERMRRARSRF